MDTRNLETVAAVLGRIPSGCSILTAAHDGCRTGMLASWIQQAALEPLLLTVAIRGGRPIEALIEGSGRMVLNLLGRDPQAMFKHFGRGFGPDEPAFEGLEIRDCPHGVILADCLGYVGCVVRSHMPAGDHQVYVVEPQAGGFLTAGEPYVHIRKSATGY